MDLSCFSRGNIDQWNHWLMDKRGCTSGTVNNRPLTHVHSNSFFVFPARYSGRFVIIPSLLYPQPVTGPSEI